jgi:hypothetical protein
MEARNVRVEIHPGYDLWMRGARYGTIERTFKRNGAQFARVRLDRLPNRLFTFKLVDLTSI